MSDMNVGGESEQAPQFAPSSINSVTTASEPPIVGAQDDFSTGASTKYPGTGFADRVKERISSSAVARKAGLADRIDEFAESLNRSSQEFAGKQDWIADAIARGGAEVGLLANSLRDADLGELLRQAQLFARRKPAMFLGASLAAGFAVARVGKIVAADLSRDDLPVMPEVGHGQH